MKATRIFVAILFLFPFSGSSEPSQAEEAAYFTSRDTILEEIYNFLDLIEPKHNFQDFLADNIREDSNEKEPQEPYLNHKLALIFRGIVIFTIKFEKEPKANSETSILHIELFNSQVQHSIRILNMKPNKSAISYIQRNIRDYLKKIEQVVFSFEQMDRDIRALIYFQFQGFAPIKKHLVTPVFKDTLAEASFKGRLSQEVEIDYDVDNNYRNLVNSFGVHDEHNELPKQIFFYLQKVKLRSGKHVTVKDYFSHRNRNFLNRSRKDPSYPSDEAVYIFTMNNASMGHIEMSLMRLESSVILRVSSPYFDYHYEYSTITRRFLLKSIERILNNLREFYFNLQQTLYFESRKISSKEEVVDYIKNVFKYQWNTLLEPENGKVLRTLDLFEKLKVQFEVKVEKNEIVVNLTIRNQTIDPKVLFKENPLIFLNKKIPLNSKFNSYEFPFTFFKSWFNICEKIFPVVTDRSLPKVSGPNESFYKMISNPFIESYYSPKLKLASDNTSYQYQKGFVGHKHSLELVLFQEQLDTSMARVIPGTGFVDYVWSPPGRAAHPFESIPVKDDRRQQFEDEEKKTNLI